MATARSARPESQSTWIHGRAPDLLLGAGLGYLISIPILYWASSMRGMTEFSVGQVLLLALAFNTPHYGATALRVYEHGEDRRRYAFFSVYMTVALVLLLVLALYSPVLGSFLVTLYFAWAPWHFAGQNYGLSLMFLGRRGVEIDPTTKRILYGTFALSFVMPLILLQTANVTAAFAANFTSTELGYSILTVGLRPDFSSVLVPILGLGYAAGFMVVVFRLLRAGASMASLMPLGLLVVVQSFWFVVPAMGLAVGRPILALAFTALWASVAHSIQYLWITSYYAQRSGRDPNLGLYFGKVLLAGCFVVALPGFLIVHLAPGAPSWTGGLAILVASVVNLHHFILDGAIWKLRDGPVSRILLRSQTGETQAKTRTKSADFASGGRGLRGALWGAAALCVLLPVIEIVDARAIDSGSIERLELAARRLGWVGRSRVSLLGTLGDAYLATGERDAGLQRYRAALEQRRDGAVLNNLAWQLATSGESTPAERQEAVQLAEEASMQANGRDYATLDTLAVAYAGVARYDAAIDTGTNAVELARAQGSGDVDALQSRLALYRSGRPFREGNAFTDTAE